MIVNKKIIFMLLFLCSFIMLLSGCSNNKKEFDKQNNDAVVETNAVSKNFDKNGTGVLNCNTPAAAAEGITVDLNYIIKYKRGNILELRSVAKISSSDQNSLDLYETSYKQISNNYKDLDYYDTSIIRDSNTLTYDVVINYDKIDVEKLLDIEGAEDNIIDNGKAKLSLWLDLAGKMGTTCEEA